MKDFENNAMFWQKLDSIYLSSDLIVDRKKNQSDPNHPGLVYPVDYGYLQDNLAKEMKRMDVFCGSMDTMKIQGIIVSANILNKDCELKILCGCNESEVEDILVFLNQTDFQKTILMRRGKEIPAWASEN